MIDNFAGSGFLVSGSLLGERCLANEANVQAAVVRRLHSESFQLHAVDIWACYSMKMTNRGSTVWAI
jgi:hypothetical protein